MNVLAASEYGTSRTAGIWRKLCAWAAAATFLGASPAMWAAPPQTAFYSGCALSEFGHATSAGTTGTATTTTTGTEYQANLEEVRHELAVAQRVLTTFGGDFLPEFETYLTTLDAILSPEVTSLAHAERLGFGLRLARVRLEEEASSVKVWARLASCIDQKPVNGRRVPARFVKARVREAEPPIGSELSSAWARNTARDFARGDADPSPRAT